MISFEEFKANYRESVSLCVSLVGVEESKNFSFELAWDFKDNEEKKATGLSVENSFMVEVPINFQLQVTDRPFFITIVGSDGSQVCQSMKCTLQDLLVEQQFSITKELASGIFLKIQIKNDENSYPIYSIGFHAQNLPLLAGLFGQCDPFMRILKKNADFGTYTLVFESEVYRNTSSPDFGQAKFSGQRLCDGDPYREIKVQIWDFSKRGGHFIVGELKTNLHNVMIMFKNKSSAKLLSGDGSKVHGGLVVKSMSISQGPSLIEKLNSGWKVNFISGIDCTGINLETSDLEDRKNIIISTSKIISDKLGYLFADGKMQYFGMNGKCCTDNLYTNYVMDVFPISGDIEKNAFNYKQVNGDFFSKTIKNFIYNTEGGSSLRISNFAKFAVDYSDESASLNNNKLFSIVCVYLWNIPEDLNSIVNEFVDLKERPTIFWFIFLGERDQETIQTLDSRKSYLLDEKHNIGTRPKTLVVCSTYNTEPESIVTNLLNSTQQMFAYFKPPKTSGA